MTKPTTAELVDFLVEERNWCGGGRDLELYDAAIKIVKAAEWLPIDAAPKDGTWVEGWGTYKFPAAVTANGDPQTFKMVWSTIRQSWHDVLGNTVIPTHYRPLPAGPEVQGDV